MTAATDQTMGSRIAYYRKQKNLTQEELGQAVGVTNQAVSKWETDTSLPDVLLLPHLARALGITLDALYGLESEAPAPTPARCTADDFPELAYDTLFRLYNHHAGLRFAYAGPSDEEQLAERARRIAGGCFLGCLSNTEGAVFLSHELAFVDRTYKAEGSEAIFTSGEVSKVLKHLSDKTVRRVLAYLYHETVATDKTTQGVFLLPQITEGCSLSSDEAEEALEKLQLLELVEAFTSPSSASTEYVFLLGNSLYPLTLCRLAELTVQDKCWQTVRDTTMILDYAFLQN